MTAGSRGGPGGVGFWPGVRGPVTVAVPATSANLGPGFDALGVALELTDEVTAEVTESGTTSDREHRSEKPEQRARGGPGSDLGIQVEVSGEGAADVGTGADHLVVKTILTALRQLGAPEPPGLRLACVNRIPHARGLGSSSAAIVAGVLLARALAGAAPEPAADLALAAEIEGHPDNVAPCLLGGFTIAWTAGAAGARAVRLTPSPQVRPVLYVPSSRGLTASARAALPQRVPHADAVFNLSRTGLLVHALTADPSLLMEATEDRLHQPYRAAGMPATAQLVSALRAAGVPAMVSGAGPAVLALTGGPAPEPLPAPAGWRVRVLTWSARGGRMLEPEHADGDPVAASRVV